MILQGWISGGSVFEVEATNELPYPNMAAFYNNEEQTLYVKRDVGDSVAVAQCVAQELGHAQLSINSDSYSRADEIVGTKDNRKVQKLWLAYF